MENGHGPFIVDLPINSMVMFHGKLLNNQMVIYNVIILHLLWLVQFSSPPRSLCGEDEVICMASLWAAWYHRGSPLVERAMACHDS